MKPKNNRPINWWLPASGAAAFAALLGIWIAVNTWDFTGHSSPDRHSPWRGSNIDAKVAVRDLSPNYIPSWTSDGDQIIFTVGRGFQYDEPPPGASTPEREIYLN